MNAWVKHEASRSEKWAAARLQRGAEHARAQLAVMVVVQAAEYARQRLARERALAVHGGRDELLRAWQNQNRRQPAPSPRHLIAQDCAAFANPLPQAGWTPP
jgi:hypothetical protein